MTAPEIKPCPFCGGKAKVEKSRTLRGAVFIACRRGHSDGTLYASLSTAIAAWNTRTPDPLLAEALEALRAIVTRWDTPAWKDAGPTGEVINRARAVLAKEGR